VPEVPVPLVPDVPVPLVPVPEVPVPLVPELLVPALPVVFELFGELLPDELPLFGSQPAASRAMAATVALVKMDRVFIVDTPWWCAA
jgi:hypothetical protein